VEIFSENFLTEGRRERESSGNFPLDWRDSSGINFLLTSFNTLGKKKKELAGIEYKWYPVPTKYKSHFPPGRC
jgi:hypothetical protein